MKYKNLWLSPIILLLFASISFAQDSTSVKQYTEQNWGLGGAFRRAAIPFNTENESSVSTFVPLLFFENDLFFLKGLVGGVKIYQPDSWRFSAIGRFRFFDIPKEFQNTIQGDVMDWGLQARYYLLDWQYFDAEIMTDQEFNYHSNISFGVEWDSYPLAVNAYARLRVKSSDFNSLYYGLNPLTGLTVDGGTDIMLGFFGTWNVTSNFYLFGAAKFTFLDKNARNIKYQDKNLIKDQAVSEIIVGFGFSNDKSEKKKTYLKNNSYFRLAYGWATPSDLSKILKGKATSDPYNNQMASFFYGYPLTDKLFGLPLDLYITTGLVWHFENDQARRDSSGLDIPGSKVQDSAQEFVLAIKLYYTIPLPVRLKLGAAEGWSYINNVTYIEGYDYENTEYRASNLLNFLDFSVDISLEDIFGKTLNNLWLGYSIHHRSGIFGSAQQFGRISGGSNYQTGYLQYHF